MGTVTNDGVRLKSRPTLKPLDEPIAVRKATLRAQAASCCEPPRADDLERTRRRPEESQDPKTRRILRPEDPKTCTSSTSSSTTASSGHDPVVAVARAVVDRMDEHETPMWRAGFLLARALRQHGFERRSDVLARSARAAVDRAEELGIVDWAWGADDLELEAFYTWTRVRITEADVVGTAVRAARARPGTIAVVVPAPIQRLVDVLWRLGALGGGVAHPSQTSLAKALGCTQRQVSRYLAIADEEFGIIECVDRKFIPGQKGMTWKVNLEHYTPPGVKNAEGAKMPKGGRASKVAPSDLDLSWI